MVTIIIMMSASGVPNVDASHPCADADGIACIDNVQDDHLVHPPMYNDHTRIKQLSWSAKMWRKVESIAMCACDTI